MGLLHSLCSIINKIVNCLGRIRAGLKLKGRRGSEQHSDCYCECSRVTSQHTLLLPNLHELSIKSGEQEDSVSPAHRR